MENKYAEIQLLNDELKERIRKLSHENTQEAETLMKLVK